MKVAPVAEVKHRFADFLEKSKSEPIFITRNGRIAAVLEAISDDEVEDYLLERSPKFRQMLDTASRKPGGITLEAYRKKRRL